VDDDGWEFADRVTGDGVVCIVAVDGQHVVLVEEFRRAVQAPVISLPAGLMIARKRERSRSRDRGGAARTARRDRLHGTQHRRGGKWADLGGHDHEQVTFFLAQDLQAGAQMPDGDEDIRVHRVPLGQLSAFLGECSARGRRSTRRSSPACISSRRALL